MRIISGIHGGRTLDAPPGRNTRPTSDRTREALFMHLQAGVLTDGFANLRVVDLFAGTGALALEALSRGAASAICVECDTQALRTIERNAAALQEQGRLTLVRGALPAALARVRDLDRADLVFIDPPYALDIVPRLLGELTARGVRTGAIAVWESDARNLQQPPEGWEVVSDRRAGDTRLRVLRHHAFTQG